VKQEDEIDQYQLMMEFVYLFEIKEELEFKQKKNNIHLLVHNINLIIILNNVFLFDHYHLINHKQQQL
jgi:hypothetical protein